MMFPTPIKNHLPDIMAEDGDDALMTAFCGKIDKIVGEIASDTKGLANFRDPMKIPSQFLEAAGESLAAGMKASDSETVKRQKLARAIGNYSLLGLWIPCKQIIDGIAGGSAELYGEWDTSAVWLMRGNEGSEENNYMASMGCDGIDTLLGIYMIGYGKKFEIPGNIYIDVDNDALTASQIAQIVEQISVGYVPAYFIVHLGYSGTGGEFVEYTVL